MSLDGIGFNSAFELYGTFAAQQSDLAKWLGDAQINTDRNLRLMYLAGWSYNADLANTLYQEILAQRKTPANIFSGDPGDVASLYGAMELHVDTCRRGAGQRFIGIALSRSALRCSCHVGRHDIDCGTGLRRLHGLLRAAQYRQAGNPETVRRALQALHRHRLCDLWHPSAGMPRLVLRLAHGGYFRRRNGGPTNPACWRWWRPKAFRRISN